MTCYAQRGAYQHYECNIGWYPYRTTTATVVLSKPGAGLILSTLAAGEGVALQSVRNPAASDHPPRRQPVADRDGHKHAWGYQRAGSITGWLRLNHLEPDPNASRKHPADGPARMDFEVGRQHCTKGAHNGCGKPSLTRPHMTVTAGTTDFRLSAHGTSIHILHHGDKVRVVQANAPQGYHLVEILAAAADGSAHPAMRGYVTTTALRRTP